MAKALAKYNARHAELLAEGQHAKIELLRARYTISRYKAVFGGGLPATWGMDIIQANRVMTNHKKARDARKAAEDAAKAERRVAREARRAAASVSKKQAVK